MNIQQPYKEYKTKEGLKYSCQYYVVFCTKYRRKVLTDEMMKRLSELFYSIANENGFEIIEANIAEDCVHLIISSDPDHGVMYYIKKLKNSTARTMKEQFPELKSRLPSLWTKSTFVSSMGDVTLEQVNKFYEDQKGR